MTSFLAQIASAYLDNEADNLIDYCFVMPGKRAAAYLSRHLAEQAAARGITIVQPAITTITDFIMDNTPYVEASRMELLFILYNVYREVVMSTYGDEAQLSDEQRRRMADAIDFDRFHYWGEVLISDFNDVDKYMVDAGELFRNIRNNKEIGTNFLTAEDIDVLSRYWSEERLPECSETFWKHTNSGELSGRFVRLWEVLLPIYTRLRQRLAGHGLCYQGMAYRQLAEEIGRSRGANLPYRRYIFVGFNMLSVSERRIFSLLDKLGMADFYWDCQSPTFAVKDNRAARFIKRYTEEFKSRYSVADRVLDTYPEIKIISAPSTTGQAKLTGDILAGLYPTAGSAPFNVSDDDKGPHPVSDLETAVVLPDEHLAIPMLHALPQSVRTINVTMGYPLRNTAVASLIDKTVSLQMRARKLRSRNTFYYEDVLAILTHPLMMRRHGVVCNRLVDTITRRNLFNIPADFFDSNGGAVLGPVFSIVSNLDDPDAVFGYLGRLLAFVDDTLDDTSEAGSVDKDGETDDVQVRSLPLQRAFVQRYQAALGVLRRLSVRYLTGNGIVMQDKTVFQLAQRMISGETVPLEGMPLEGLQIMGMLETRALDFDTIIMPSMNERIFPRKHYQRSFIPYNLRRGYNMATLDHQESIFAYYFYRLITRARRVYLLYDGRSSGTRSGQCSRYISQLQYLFDIPSLSHSIASFEYTPDSSLTRVSIPKTDRLRDIIRRYLPGSGEPRYLSASSINKFIDCPLKFCLSELEGYGEPDTVKDYIDEGMMGSVVHAVLENMYNEEKGGRPSVVITADTIARLSDEGTILRHITRAINSNFNRLPDERLDTELNSESRLLADVMARMVRKMLSREPVPFTYIDSEWRRWGTLRVSDTMSFNFTLSIDRIDRVRDGDDEILRVVDYKTGGDDTSAKDWDTAFDPDVNHRPKVMVQLFMYCNGYAQLCDGAPYDGAIKPQVYKLKTIVKEAHRDCRLDGKTVLDYRQDNDRFLSRLENALAPLFDNDTPFTAARTDNPCKYCQFTTICGRKVNG